MSYDFDITHELHHYDTSDSTHLQVVADLSSSPTLMKKVLKSIAPKDLWRNRMHAVK